MSEIVINFWGKMGTFSLVMKRIIIYSCAKSMEFLFSRGKNTNDLTNYPNWRIGLSLAASHSWGVSLAVGMGIMFSKGLLPFIIWTIGNILSVPLFGIVRKYMPLSKYGPNFIFPMVMLFFFVEFFCIILNLQGLFNGFVGEIKTQGQEIKLFSHAFLEVNTAPYLVMAIGLFVVWYIHKGGLRVSVLTDFGQYAVQLASVVLMATLAICLGEQNEVQWIVVSEQVNGLEWAKFGFFGIIVGSLGIGHQWQRFSAIKEENIFPSSIWGGFFFGIYMIFVGLAGFNFTPHMLLGGIFLITMLALATSSIDSSVAGLEYVIDRLKPKKFNQVRSYLVASIIAIITIVMWPQFMKMGITEIWTFMAYYRLLVVVFFIISTYLATVVVKIIRDNKNEF